jgi:hypothetical protein
VQWQLCGGDFDVTLLGVFGLHIRFLKSKNGNLNGFLYVRQPIGMLGVLSADTIEEQRLQTMGYRPA